MKKLFIFMFIVMLLTGCSHKMQETTFMLTFDDTLYALYNQDGEELTDALYKTYKEVKDVGYIVTDESDRVGLISLKGKELIAFGEYETLEAVDQMFYATKTVEKKEDEKEQKKETKETSSFVKENLYVLNSQGEVLYSADETTGIMKSGLPVIQKNDAYIVLYHQGDELYHDQEAVSYAYQYDYSSSVIVGFADYSQLFYFDNEEKNNIEMKIEYQGNYDILAASRVGVVLNDVSLKSMLYVDIINNHVYQYNMAIKEAEFDDVNLTLKNNDQIYIYQVGKTPIMMNTYYLSPSTYLVRSADIYGPHSIYKNAEKVMELENCQLYPVAQKIASEIFPAYVKDEGYQYYNFNGEKVIDQSYILAEPFDDCHTAIVKATEEGYSLIDESGKILSKNAYSQMKYIGHSYYAVYNEDGALGIINNQGEEVFAIEYTSLPENPIINYEGYNYFLLTKNGRSYIYDINDKYKEILSQEGNIVFYEKGYFKIGDLYYTIEGELIK